MPSIRKQLNIRLTDETEHLLLTIKDRDGTPYSVQVERAMRLLAKERGIAIPIAEQPRQR